MVGSDRREGGASPPSNESQYPMPPEVGGPQTELKIVRQNVNTISADVPFNYVGLILEEVKKQNVDILTLNEFNINLSNNTVRNEYKRRTIPSTSDKVFRHRGRQHQSLQRNIDQVKHKLPCLEALSIE